MPKCWRNWLDKCFEGKVLILTVHYDLFTTISFKLPFVIVISQGIVIGSWVQFFPMVDKACNIFGFLGFVGFTAILFFKGDWHDFYKPWFVLQILLDLLNDIKRNFKGRETPYMALHSHFERPPTKTTSIQSIYMTSISLVKFFLEKIS